MKDKLHRFNPASDATHSAGCSGEARTALLKVRALDAHAAIITLLIAQSQSVRESFGTGLAATSALEDRNPVQEAADLAIG